jgi:hypothetical protein
MVVLPFAFKTREAREEVRDMKLDPLDMVPVTEPFLRHPHTPVKRR